MWSLSINDDLISKIWSNIYMHDTQSTINGMVNGGTHGTILKL